MKIGKLKVKNRILLAPMLEPNDVAFRLLCKKCGCGLTYTGMISPLSKQKLDLQDRPAIQIFGKSPAGIPEFIKKYDSKVSLWDFNLGCPSKLSKRLGHGAYLHEDINSIEEILKVMRNSTKKPITIKLRKSPRAEEIAKMAERYCDAIAIHPRTIQQGYSGETDYEFALKIKKNSKLPIIYSGNVNEKNALIILDDFDFIQIGREAIGNSNIFSNLTNNQRIEFEDYMILAKKYNLKFIQIKYQAMNFTKSRKNARILRGRLISAKNVEEIEAIMKTNK